MPRSYSEVDNPASVESSESESEDDIWSQEPLKKWVGEPSLWKKNITKQKCNSGETKGHMEAKTLGHQESLKRQVSDPSLYMRKNSQESISPLLQCLLPPQRAHSTEKSKRKYGIF